MRFKMMALIAALFSLGLAPIPQLNTTTEISHSSSSAGGEIIIAISIAIPEGFHLYSNPMGPGIGMPLTVSPEANNNISWQSAKADPAHKYSTPEFPDQWTWVWEEDSHIFITGTIADFATKQVKGIININGLICKTSCLPINEDIPYSIKLSDSAENTQPFSNNNKLATLFTKAVDFPLEQVEQAPVTQDKPDTTVNSTDTWQYQPQENQGQLSLGLALIFAFLAGIILNFMPCVLPVLGIKIIAFSEGRTGSKAQAITHSLAFSAGMVLVFLLLGTLAAFAGMSWGEQFQNPVFIVALITIMFVFGLGLFDLFLMMVPQGVCKLDQDHGKSGLWGNFLNGIFATVLATPCSGPLLGATLAWSVTQPKVTIYLVFLTLGLGMACPYILLASSRRLSAFIPKPGAWMEDLKHILGFFLFGFAVYLMIGLPRDWVIPTIGLLVFVGAGIMLYGRLAPFGSPLKKKIIALILMIAIIISGWHLNFNTLRSMISTEQANSIAEKSSTKWHSFDRAALQAAHARGQSVIIDFTANWCMNCQFNKIRVYYSAEVEKLIKEKNIYAIKADLTSNNPAAESLLKALGSNSIPFFAIFPGDNPQKPIIMRDLVSKKAVIKELEHLTSTEK